MKTVGRLGSYITKGVYTVSGSLHPFGGAIDIIVVEQPDGSFRSSPWYVRFGKFQGVLKANDKVVKIGVNGVEANFNMYLDPRGEAYFLREVEEGEPVLSPSSARFETDSGLLKILRPVRSEGYNSDSSLPNSGNRDDATDGKIVVRSASRRSKIMGMVFGQRSVSTKDDCFQEVDNGTGVPRLSSLERAEIAADLLELQWSTNLATSKSKKGSRLPPFSSPDRLAGNLQPDSINHEMQRLGSEKLCEGNGLEEQHTCGGMDVASPGSATPRKDNGSDKVHSFVRREALPGLEVELDGVKELNHQTLNEIKEEKDEFEHGVVSGGVIKRGLDLRLEIVPSASVSESSEEEHLQFGDLDEFRPVRVLDGSESPNSMCIESTGEVNGQSVEIVSSSEKIEKTDAFGPETELASSPINIHEIRSLSGSEAGHMAESMPNISSHIGSLDAGLLMSSSYSLDVSSKPMEWTLRKDGWGSSHLNSGNVNQAVREHSNGEDLGNGDGVTVASTICDPSKEPVSQKQLGSTMTSQTALNAPDIVGVERLVEKDTPRAKVAKKLARVITPTSEQIASLNLQEGKNIVTFTFSTPMLGKQEVDARIFLWKWNTRVVISDVDGTITKSDVLGQFMPLVGVDWNQTGVANLFSAIKENGYQLLFLSARAISQAYLTRRFLCGLKQDGKTLPEGPVVISPDGLFPSLFREVIRRAPHEFKIACLEDIKALFPPDCQPFYAGFGNRDTDELSYVKVGIPKGKIFIINPKGEVSVHRRVDRKSYHSIHDLVHGMFPSTLTFEQARNRDISQLEDGRVICQHSCSVTTRVGRNEQLLTKILGNEQGTESKVFRRGQLWLPVSWRVNLLDSKATLANSATPFRQGGLFSMPAAAP